MRTVERTIVGGFIFSKDGYILLGKSASGGVYSDNWLIPGGGIEPGETKLQAVKREVLEETGVDISDATITPLKEVSLGESQKTLKDGQRVLVKMEFYDFVVELPYPASEIDLVGGDDFESPQWHAVTDLKDLNIGPTMQATLTKLGHL